MKYKIRHYALSFLLHFKPPLGLSLYEVLTGDLDRRKYKDLPLPKKEAGR